VRCSLLHCIAMFRNFCLTMKNHIVDGIPVVAVCCSVCDVWQFRSYSAGLHCRRFPGMLQRVVVCRVVVCCGVLWVCCTVSRYVAVSF